MCRFALLVIAVTLLVGSMAQAASYQTTDGTIVDPILDTSGSTHPYSGNNLKAGAILDFANLAGANLTGANLPGAGLHYADLPGAFLTDANLTNANLHQANFDGANLSGANLTDTGLAWARGDGTIFDSFTILKNGKTIAEHGFDAAGLEQYFSDQDATFSNVTMAVVPVPGAAPLGIAGLICVVELRRRALRRSTKARR